MCRVHLKLLFSFRDANLQNRAIELLLFIKRLPSLATILNAYNVYNTVDNVYFYFKK